MDSSIGESVPVFLTDLLPPEEKKVSKRVKKGKPQNWDTRKQYTVQVQTILQTGDKRHKKLATRVNACANLLNFGWVQSLEAGVNELKFKSAYFCRVRTCPICQWRRSQMLLARFFQAFPRIQADYPTIRYVFLTLTVANCPTKDLKATIKTMNKAWDRLAKRRGFPAIGFIRSLEITKETDTYDKVTKKLLRKARPDYAHPHFHILLALPPSYFSRNYISTEKWALLWQESLRIDYTPICDVRIVKPKYDTKNATTGDSVENNAINDINSIKAAIAEVLKYTVKPADMVKDSAFLLELVNQLHNVRSVSLGGIFKHYMQELDDDAEGDILEPSENNAGGLYFGWRQPVKRYQLKP